MQQTAIQKSGSTVSSRAKKRIGLVPVAHRVPPRWKDAIEKRAQIARIASGQVKSTALSIPAPKEAYAFSPPQMASRPSEHVLLETTPLIDGTNSHPLSPRTVFWLRFFAYALPVAFLCYVLYWNFLPFGYEKTYTINVGSKDDTKVGEFYLEPSRNLSVSKINVYGETFREFNGEINAIFNPSIQYVNGAVVVKVFGDNVAVVPPKIKFDPDRISWDANFDFKNSIPEYLGGNAYHFGEGAYFDGNSTLEMTHSLEYSITSISSTTQNLASTTDMYERGPFSIYVEWQPANNDSDFQQLIGHFNWELLQNKRSVEFRIGRMDNQDGQIVALSSPVGIDFFTTKHNAIAIYDPDENKGFIELFIDGQFVGKKNIYSSKIWDSYGNKNLSFGKSGHGVATNFKGTIYRAGIISKNILNFSEEATFNIDDNAPFVISVISDATTSFKKIELNAAKK